MSALGQPVEQSAPSASPFTAVDMLADLPGFTADLATGLPQVESYPIQDHDPSDYVESFPIGEEAGPLVLESVDTPAARFLEEVASGELPPQQDQELRNLQHKYNKHGHHWGMDKNASFRVNAAAYAQTLIDHKNNPDTEVSFGTFRGATPEIHYFNPITGLWLSVFVDSNISRLATFMLDDDQVRDLVEKEDVR